MSGTQSGKHSVDVLRKLVLVAVLVVIYTALNRWATPSVDFDPRGLLALGFVILAAYTVGELAEVIKLPHITGYLLAGLLLGPSTAHIIHDAFPGLHLPPPFDEGVLNERVKQQLLLLDDLALALIALTAGGELKLEALRKGMRRIAAIASLQVIGVGGAVTVFLWAISGAIPGIGLEQLAGISSAGALALGAVVGSISLATSPAATIAVINGSGAKGETTSTVLSVVVLKDVLVVMAFSAATAVATGVLGLSGGEGGFLLSLGHILLSIVVGVGIGFGLHFYLRFVGAEILLFLVALIYAATFVCHEWHLEAALVFIAAGFVSSNFSDRGDELIHEVERLSLPVYVVFFTLAGAKLHLDVLWGMAAFAIALVAVRMAALYATTRAGALLGGGGVGLQQYGWMGFVSQAGLSVTLATSVSETYPGAIGEGLFALLLGGVAINEMVGPVMLQIGLTRAGDTAGTAAPEPVRPPTSPAIPDGYVSWGGPLASGVPAIDEGMADLERDIRSLVDDLETGPLHAASDEYSEYVGELRRDFLRGHRRVMVAAQGATAAEELAGILRNELVILGDAWRDRVLDRAARARAVSWSPGELVGVIDSLVSDLPTTLVVPLDAASLDAREESRWMQVRRSFLRLRTRLGGVTREIDLRALGRYHLGGRAPLRLEGVAALVVNEEGHMASRTAELFATVASGWKSAGEILRAGEQSQEELAERLTGMRSDIEGDFSAILQEIGAVHEEGGRRAASVLGHLLREIKDDVRTLGTLDLPHRSRRYGRVYAERNAGLRALTTDLAAARRTVAARMGAVALDLELVALEGRIQETVGAHAEHVERDIRGRGPLQLARVEEALGKWLERVGAALDGTSTADQISGVVKDQASETGRVIREALRLAQQLRAELAGDEAVAPLVRTLLDAAQSLTDWYTIPVERIPEGDWNLPPEVATVEVPFRELTVAYVESQISLELATRTWALADRVGGLVEHLMELDRVVMFNAELASAELDVFSPGSPLPEDTLKLVTEMLIGAVGRSRARTERLAEEVETWPAQGRDGIHDAVIEGVKELRGQVVDGAFHNLRNRLFGDRTVARGLFQAGDWGGLVKAARQQVTGVVLGALGPDRVESARQTLGLPGSEASIAELRDVLAAPKTRVELPVVYRRLFSDRALEAGDLIVGRERELARAVEALQADRPLRSVAIVGMRGSGTSSLASALARTWQGPVRRIDLEGPVDVATVESWFADHRSDVLTVLSGIRWLYQMRPGGLEPLHRMASLLVERSKGAPWVFSSDVEVWRTVAQLSNLDSAAGAVVSLGPLSSDDLTSAVLARHQMSGYELVFDAAEDVGWQLWHLVLRGSEGQTRQREAWFRTLHEASGGVMHDGLRLWLASIVEVDEVNGTIRVGTVPRPPVARLSALDDRVMLTLVQALRQGWIDASLYASLFRDGVAESEIQLVSLAHRGLLQRMPNGRYEVARHLRNPIQRALLARGWV